MSLVRSENIPCPHPTNGTECNRELIDFKHKNKALFLDWKGDQDSRKRRTGHHNKNKYKKIYKIKKSKKKKKKNKNKKRRTKRSIERNKRNKNKRRRMQRSARNFHSKTHFCSKRKNLVGLQGNVGWASDGKGKRKVPILASEECRKMLSTR